MSEATRSKLHPSYPHWPTNRATAMDALYVIWPSIETENVKLKACARCRVAVYCSKECQTKDWPSHKYVTFGLWFLTPITRVSDL